MRRRMPFAPRMAIAAVLLAPFVAGPAFAAPPVVDFRPPEVEPSKVCSARKSDDLLVKQWTAWDGKTLPPALRGRDLDDELNRLRNLDPNRFFDTVLNALNLRRKNDPHYSRAAYLLDVVALYIRAGRVDELEGKGYIEELEAIGPAASPGTVNFLADLYLDGTGVKKDEARGLQRKLQAAYNGDPNAVLYLAKKTSEGETIQGWDMEPKVAFTLGFSSLLGKLDKDICGRVRRIARAYEDGGMVARDPALADAWYRFAADLGDGASAWEVARAQLSGDGVEKDNTALLKYLKQAFDDGIVPARVEMAKIYENGVLLPEDPAMAMSIYDDLATDGHQEGYEGAIALQEKIGFADDADRDAYRRRLEALTQFGDAPGWAFSRLAGLLEAEDGAWGDKTAIRQLLVSAADHGDADGELALARLYLRDESEDERRKAVTLLENLITKDGRLSALPDLKNALVCRAPAGPDLAAWAEWRPLERTSAVDTGLPADSELEMLAAGSFPDAAAELQREALGGSSAAAGKEAALQVMLLPAERDGVLSHWRAYAGQRAGGEAAFLGAFYDVTTDHEARDDVFVALRQMASAGDPAAQIALADIYLAGRQDMPGALDQATGLVEAVGGRIKGSTLWRLDDAWRAERGGGYRPPDAILAGIAGYGDFEALLFASGKAADETEAERLYRRAMAVMPCDINALARKAEFGLTNGRPDDAADAAAIAEALSPQEGWQKVRLADIFAALGSIADRRQAFALYSEADGQGYRPASWRLLDWFADTGGPFYDESRYEAVLLKLLRDAGPSDLYGIVSRVGKAPADVAAAVFYRFDIEAAYRKAAAAGNPVAMRELAKLLQHNQASPEAEAEAETWLTKAGEDGDPEAMMLLAQSYAFGLDRPASPEMARKWLEAASAAGEADAGDMLSRMKTQ